MSRNQIVRSPLTSINFHTQLPIKCDTILISYKPVHSLMIVQASTLQELEDTLQKYESSYKFMLLCGQEDKKDVEREIDRYIERAIEIEKNERLDEQLMDNLGDSEQVDRKKLSVALQGIIERTQLKVRQSRIKNKMLKIDTQIKKFQQFQAESEAKCLLEGHHNNISISAFNSDRKKKKEQKRYRKRIQNLKMKKELLENNQEDSVQIDDLLQSSESQSQSSSCLI